MSLQNLQNVMKDRYEWENKRNKDLENKAYRFLFLSTIIIPLTKYLDMNYDFLVMIFTVISVILFILVIRLKEFLHPLDPDNYVKKNGEICEDMIEKDMALEEKELVEYRVREYIKCSYHNKKVSVIKIKYLKYLMYNLMAQIIILIILYGIQSLRFN